MRALALLLLLSGCASVFDAPRPVDRTGAYSIKHWNAEGKPISVNIRPVGCTSNDGLAYTHVLSEVFAIINLCAMKGLLQHELAHVAGMQHTPWREDGCAIVTAPGTKTKYRAGQRICHVNGEEIGSDR